MPASSKPARVVAIVEPGSTQQQIAAALSSQDEFHLVEVLSNLEKLVRDLHATGPEIILVDDHIGAQPTLDIIDDIALQVPDAAIVAILPDNDPVKAQQVTLAGARAFLVQPFTQVNLLSTLRRVRELESRRAKLKPEAHSGPASTVQPLKTLAVFSPRGGVGCSTLAANLAVALQEETGKRVLLMEGKLFFGHLDVLLNIRSHNTLADLLPHANNIDDGLVRDVIAEHVSGLHVLLGPADLQVAQGVRPQDLFGVVVGLQRFYDYLVIDAGSLLDENTVTLLDAADRILLATTPDLAALRDASRFLQISRTLAYPANKILILLNRAGLLGGVRAKDIEIALKHEVYARIPDDGPNTLRSLNRGIPLLVKYPRSPASKAIQQIARRLAKLHEPELAGKAAALATVKDKAKGSAKNDARLAANRSR
jgi:pilus assembly protein CpaE